MEDVVENCLQKGGYGYAEGKPCVIVKMKKIFGFIPKLNDSSDYLKIHCKGNSLANDRGQLTLRFQ